MNSSHQTAQANIERIAELERQFLEKRSTMDRVADGFAAFTGSIKFVVLHLVLFLFWIMANTKHLPGVPAFDPYPFMLLSLLVSLEAVLLSTFVLMKQNRMAKRSDRRNELNLQIDLLSEREATKMLQMLQAICKQLGLHTEADDAEVRELSEMTKVETIAHQLEEKMPQ